MKDDTLLIHAGRDPFANHGIVNPPVYHASTVLFPTLDAWVNAGSAKVKYGRRGTPTSFALEEAIAELEGGFGAQATPSGIAAIATVLLTFVKAGDHILVTDNIYHPTRHFCDKVLARLGVETEYFDPMIGERIAGLIRPGTSLVFTESPGSLTFEVHDLPAIAGAARDAGVTVITDNTWAAGYYCKPLALGADVVVQSGTKYVSGHADSMMGLIVSREEETCERIKTDMQLLGLCAGPDDIYLALRGFRTLSVRLERHYKNGLKLANWLKARPEVVRVVHPALEDDPGHALWKRDYTGACGLFGFELNTTDQGALAAMMDGLTLHGIGASWGGFESLLIPTWPNRTRSATEWEASGQMMRIHVGLEDTDDLIADLEAGLDRLRKAG